MSGVSVYGNASNFPQGQVVPSPVEPTIINNNPTTDLSGVLTKLSDIESAIENQPAPEPAVEVVQTEVVPNVIVDLAPFATQYDNIARVLTELVSVVGKLAGIDGEDVEALKTTLQETTQKLSAEYTKTAELNKQLSIAQQTAQESQEKVSQKEAELSALSSQLQSLKGVLQQIDNLADV